MCDFDLIVIGAGPGGYVAAIRAAQDGLKTCVVEERDCGGTCLNRGCIPTKALLHTGNLYRSASEEFAANGLQVENLSCDWDAMHEHKCEVVEQLRSGVEMLLDKNGVTLMRGHGKLVGEGKVEVTKKEGAKEEVTAKKILLASGSVPSFPEQPGMDLPGVISSDDILEGVPEKAEKIAILGGGIIGCEFASFYNDLGLDVVLIITSPRPLRAMDEELGKTLRSVFKKRKIDVMTKTRVTGIVEKDGKLAVQILDKKDKEGEVIADQVLVAKGRRPNMEALLGEGLELEMDGKFVKVNEKFETSLPNVYAIGDLIGGMQLAHEASAEGEAAVAYMQGKEPLTRPDIIPGAVYTQPEIGSIGLTEDEAKEQGIEYFVGKYQMAGNGKSIIEGQNNRGFIKLLFEEGSERLIGAHMFCGRASDLISEFAVEMAHGATREDLLMGMRPHPTFCEGITEAAEAAADRSIHTVPKK